MPQNENVAQATLKTTSGLRGLSIAGNILVGFTMGKKPARGDARARVKARADKAREQHVRRQKSTTSSDKVAPLASTRMFVPWADGPKAVVAPVAVVDAKELIKKIVGMKEPHTRSRPTVQAPPTPPSIIPWVDQAAADGAAIEFGASVDEAPLSAQKTPEKPSTGPRAKLQYKFLTPRAPPSGWVEESPTCTSIKSATEQVESPPAPPLFAEISRKPKPVPIEMLAGEPALLEMILMHLPVIDGQWMLSSCRFVCRWWWHTIRSANVNRKIHYGRWKLYVFSLVQTASCVCVCVCVRVCVSE